MDALSQWLLIPLMALFIPPSILFLIQINVIRHIKSLHSHFYYFYIIRGINIILYEIFQIYGKLPNFGLFIGVYKILPRILLTLVYFPSLYLYYCDNLSAIFMILYRLTGISFPLKHKMLWKFAFPFAILIIFGAPFPFCTYLLAMNVYLDSKTDLIANESTYSIHYIVGNNETDPVVRLVSESTYFAICSIPICLILNVLTLLAFYKTKNVQQDNSTTSAASNANIERKITIFIVVTIFFHLAYLIFQVIVHCLLQNGFINVGFMFGRINEIVFIVSEFTAPTFLLHWTSPTLRGQSFKTIKCLIPFRLFPHRANATNIGTHADSKPAGLRLPSVN